MSIGALNRRRSDAEDFASSRGLTGSETQHILVTDIISEGPIGGLCEGGKSIFVNGDSLLATDISPYYAPQGQTVTISNSSAIAQVNVGKTTFSGSYDSSFGDKFLIVYGAYGPLKATSNSQIIPVYRGSGAYNVTQVGVAIEFTRASGTALQASFNHDSGSNPNNWGSTNFSKLTNNGIRATLNVASGARISGVITGATDGGSTFTFRSQDRRLTEELWTTTDYNGSTEHTLFLHLYLAISAISGNQITLTQNAPISKSNSRFSITSPKIPTTGTQADPVQKAHKYPGTSFNFNPGTVDQQPLSSLTGIGTSSISLTDISNTALELSTAITINASGTQASLIDEVKIIIAYPNGLYGINESNGDKFATGAAYKMELAIDRNDGSAQVFEVLDGNNTLNNTPVFAHGGDYRNAVTFEFRIGLEEYQPFNGFTIRMTRMTNHDFNAKGSVPRYGSYVNTGDDDHAIVGVGAITAVTGLIKEKLNFPYTANANLKLWSKTFNRMPKRTYECFGLKVKVPSNYVTREENDGLNALYTRNVSTGVVENSAQFWDGNFRDDLIYTDNPAWVFHDILQNDRYGLGDYLKEEDIDIFNLYKIAKHCDELVPDGRGGTEPRFRANLYLTKATDAYKVLKDMATIFRGILYWSESKFLAVIDEKKEPIYNFSRSNVIDGHFSFESTGDKTRVNQFVVEWNNPDSDYKLEPILIEDKENQIKTKRIKSEKAVAFGCTSYGQALRYGRWKLWTSINQTQIVNFATTVNAGFLGPGDIINIQNDPDFDIQFSGRVSSYDASVPSITIDRDISADFSGGHSYEIAVLLPKRTILLNQDSATIATSSGNVSKTRGQEITEATVQGSVKTLIHSTTGTVNGAVNNSKNVTLDSSNSLITVGDTITGTGIDRLVTVAGISGTSLTLSIEQTIADNATLTFENLATTQQNILSAVDTSGNHLNLQLESNTIVENRTLTTGSTTTSDGKNTIPVSSAFSVAPSTGAVWAIKQIPTGSTQSTTASYKPYKILNISEEADEVRSITAVEYFEAKYDVVDNEEFTLAVDDPLFPPELIEEVPAPRNLKILREPEFNKPGEELNFLWDPPLPVGSSGVSTAYENLAEFEITHTFGPQTAPETIKASFDDRSYIFNQVPDGFHTITIQSISGKGRRSAKATIDIEINDTFNDDFKRSWGGIVLGGFSSQDVSVSNAGADKGTLRFDTDDFVAAPFYDPQLAVGNTTADANSFSLDLTPLANANYPQQTGPGNAYDWGYAFMDFSKLDASNPNADALKLVAYKRDSSLADVTYWYDVTKFLADANSIWTSLGNVTVTQGSPKVTASSSIFSNLKVPEAIKIGSAFGAKVAYVESGTVLYLDRSWTAASATGQALSKQELDIDYRRDFIIAPVSYHAAGTDDDGSGGRYGLGGGNGGNSFLDVRPELDKVGRAIVVDSDVQFLEYNASEAQQNASDINLTLQAVGFEEAEFQVTGTGFNSVSTAASSFEFADLTVTNNKVSIKIHETDDQATIAYNSAAPLSFTITAREKQFPNNTNRQVTATYNIGKIREGSQGNSTAVVYLYKNSTSVLTSSDIGSGFPTVTVTLSGTNAGTITAISSGSISGAGQIGTTGWHKSPQTLGTNEKQYIVAATANGTGATDDIAFGEWSDPVQFSGTPGQDGFSSATVELFQLTNSASAPADPTGDLTYTFSTGLITSSGNLNNWTQTASSPTSSNKYLWKITAAAVATTLATPANTTDTIATNDWSTAILAAQFGSQGQDGAAGKRTFVGTLFYTVGVVDANQDGTPDSGAPALPSGSITYTFSTAAFSGGNMNNWAFASPTFAPFNGSDQKLLWYACTVTAEENTSGGGIASGSNLTFTNRHIVHSFTGVVAFTDLSASSGSTVIHGSRITTGRISSSGNANDYGTDSDGNYATDGTHLDLENGRLRSPDFFIDGSGASFGSGLIGGSTSSAWRVIGNRILGGGDSITATTDWPNSNVTLDSANKRIVIRDVTDSSGNGTNRVILGKLT